MDKISSAYNPNFKRSEQSVTIQQACTGGETVLVIQDNIPWCGASNPEGAVVAELIAQGISYCMINSSQIGTTDLSQFRDIIIPSDQSQTFYNNLFPNGNMHPNIEDYVQQGGILSANLADLGWNFGSWEAYSFVGGLTHVFNGDSDNNIADPNHPIITGDLTCNSGNCGQILDSDLDGWNYSSHGYFNNLPAGTDVIIVDGEGRPVMIEYPYGNGVVIASLTTTEFRYDGCPQRTERKLLANEIAYQVNFCDTCECTERDITFTATIDTGVPFPVVDVGTPVFNGNMTDNVECTTDTCLQTVTFTVCDTTLECCITVGTINFSGTADLLITVPATLETDCGMQEVGVTGAVTVPIDQTCFTCEDEQVCPDTICRLLETVQDTFTATIISDTQIQVSGTVRFNCP